MSDSLKGLKPESFFKWFEEICRIPHVMRHEEKISLFLENFAKERGLTCVRDAMGNILIRVPAAEGYENEPPILIQGHMDMVGAQDETSTINLLTDPLELCLEGNKLKAKGTTLGADDGVAIAAMLAIADDPSIPHPELEFLCTVQEEAGLVGIQNFDMGLIKARRMINIDAGSTHTMCVSAAGGRIVSFEKQYEASPAGDTVPLQVKLQGGLGGHAGILAHKNRACCINIMGELLFGLQQEMPVALAEIAAPGPSIHGSCEADIRVPAEDAQRAASLLEAQFRAMKERYRKTDPDIELVICPGDDGKVSLSAEDSADIIRIMFLLHTGVRKSDADDRNIIITSVTFAAISLVDGAFTGRYAVRSVEDSVGLLWHKRMEELVHMCGFTSAMVSQYPAWPINENCEMQLRFARAHKELFGSEIVRLHEHASIELNVIMQSIPGMDAVAIQPTATHFHTPGETLYVDEVQPFWDMLLAVLAQK